MEMDRLVSSPTPTLPMRHPGHHRRLHPQLQPLPPLPAPSNEEERELVPPPLFSKRTRTSLPSETIHVAVLEIPHLPPSTSSSNASSPISSTASIWSSSSSFSSSLSSPATSAPSSPNSRPRSLSYASSPTPPWWTSFNQVPPTPRHSLRRKPSPKKETLRSLRVKESEACLQRCYDQQTMAYINGTIFARTKMKGDLESLAED